MCSLLSLFQEFYSGIDWFIIYIYIYKSGLCIADCSWGWNEGPNYTVALRIKYGVNRVIIEHSFLCDINCLVNWSESILLYPASNYLYFMYCLLYKAKFSLSIADNLRIEINSSDTTCWNLSRGMIIVGSWHFVKGLKSLCCVRSRCKLVSK